MKRKHMHDSDLMRVFDNEATLLEESHRKIRAGEDKREDVSLVSLVMRVNSADTMYLQIILNRTGCTTMLEKPVEMHTNRSLVERFMAQQCTENTLSCYRPMDGHAHDPTKYKKKSSFPSTMRRTQNPHSTTMEYASGAVVIAGTVSWNEAMLVMALQRRHIESITYPNSDERKYSVYQQYLCIQNNVFTMKMGFCIYLGDFANSGCFSQRQHVPDTFSAVKFSINSSTTTFNRVTNPYTNKELLDIIVLVFASGQIIFVGVFNIVEVYFLVEYVYKSVLPFQISAEELATKTRIAKSKTKKGKKQEKYFNLDNGDLSIDDEEMIDPMGGLLLV